VKNKRFDNDLEAVVHLAMEQLFAVPVIEFERCFKPGRKKCVLNVLMEPTS
jgi:hypothetical protein